MDTIAKYTPSKNSLCKHNIQACSCTLVTAYLALAVCSQWEAVRFGEKEPACLDASYSRKEPQLSCTSMYSSKTLNTWSNHKENLRRKEKLCFVAVVASSLGS